MARILRPPFMVCPIAYLLRDEFFDTLAAGAVNGTPATPGPGTRADVDTGGPLISVASGLLRVAAGTVNWATTAHNYIDAIPRTAGRVLLCRAIPANANLIDGPGFKISVGADGGEVTNKSASFLHHTAGSLRVVANQQAMIAVGTYTAAAHQLAIVLRAAGAFFFYQVIGGQWLMVWPDARGTTNPVYVGLGVRSGAVDYDYYRLPAQLWTPTPLASDSFNRANASLHNSLTDGAAVEEVGGAGLTWTAVTWTIAGNMALNTPTVSVTDLIVNGGFAADTDWDHGAGWSIALGVASIAGAATANEVAHVPPLTTHTWYQVTWTNSAMAAGTIGPLLGTNALKAFSTDGAKTVTGVANGTAFAMAGTAATGSIDDVTCKAITLSTLFATVPCATPDVLIELPITDSASNAGGKQVGVVVNLDSAASPANFIIAYLVGDATMKVDEWVAGARTNKVAAAVTYAAGAKIKLVRDGTSLRAFYNEIAVGTVQTMTANAGTLHGMFSTQATPTVDNLAIWARGIEGQYSRLVQF